MKKWKLVLGIILTVLVLIVVLQNMQPVETKLLFVSVTMPRATLAAVTLLVGIAIGLMIRLSFARRKGNRDPSGN